MSTFTESIAHEMLQGGNRGIGFRQSASAQPLDFRGGHGGYEHRVFPHVLLNTAPSRVATDVKNRTVADMGSLEPHLLADDLSDVLHQSGIPGRGKPQSCGKHSGAYSHMTMRGLFGKKQGNAQAGMRDGILLEGVGTLSRKPWSKSIGEALPCPRICTEGSPQHAHREVGKIFFEAL